MQSSEHRPTQAIVDLAAIRNNLTLIKEKFVPNQLIYVAVKANAYGHGAIQVGKAALEAGAHGLLVATVDEGIELRQAGITEVPILVLGLTDPRGIAEIIHYNLTLTVGDATFFTVAINQLKKTNQLHLVENNHLKIHLAVDTGMGRIGLQKVAEIVEFKQTLEKHPWVHWEGVFTHFSTASGGPSDYIEVQWQRWQELLVQIPDTVKYRHHANTAMTYLYEQYPTDIARIGIGVYGIDPQDIFPESLGLTPALQLVSELIYVKQVAPGRFISYGATYETTEHEWIATIPIGYADGWFRHYHSVKVLVQGQECPIVGVINMDQLMIRLPKEYSVGITVTLIGKDGKQENHVSKIAKQIDTIGYEILCGISDRVPRIYLNERK